MASSSDLINGITANDLKCKKRYIMKLKGFHLSDIISVEDIFDQRIMEEADVVEDTHLVISSKNIVHYTTNPITFTTLDKWPTKSNCKCWTCDRYFTTRPWFMPTSYVIDIITKKEVFGTEGNFCISNCVQDWINTHHSNDGTYDDKTKMLKMVYKIYHEKIIYKILPSISKTKRKEYCGEYGLTEQEYVEKLLELNDFSNNQSNIRS